MWWWTTRPARAAPSAPAPAITDLIGRQVDLLCDQTTHTTPQIEGKKVKAFAVTTSKCLTTPALKNLPTLAESGLKNFEITIWHGLYAPKGTPTPVLKKINEALKMALKDPDFVKKQEGLGAVVTTDQRTEPAEHKKFVLAEMDKWVRPSARPALTPTEATPAHCNKRLPARPESAGGYSWQAAAPFACHDLT